MSEVTFYLAFLAGVVSFLSPCVMPLIPSYITFITGMSFEELTSGEDRKKALRLTITNSLVFILGFSVVFINMGLASSLIGQWLKDYEDAIRIGGGILVIIFGLFISGVIKLDFLMSHKKFHLKGKPAGYIGTFLVGLTFAVGWTPCVGPILGTILAVAINEDPIRGALLLTAYSAGLGLPFFLAAIAFNTFIGYTKVLNRHMKAIMFISGGILIAFGILLLTNNLRYLTGLFPDLGIEL
jgi:cytochrome c-type biogenesis protein